MAEVRKHILKVYEQLKRTSFFENTIVVFTSDHGEMLGAHGGMFEKYYNAYEETLHVPFIISNPKLFPEPKVTELVTSHVDLVPTLLGLAEIDQKEALRALAKSHSEAQPLVGRDLSSFLLGEEAPRHEPIYFMTDDNVEAGPTTTEDLIRQPKNIETVITQLPALSGTNLWKYSRYCSPDAESSPAYECYDLTRVPQERNNRCGPLSDPLPQAIQVALDRVLNEQREQKRLSPQSKNLQTTDVSRPVPLDREGMRRGEP
jgi:hypothetical protein